MTHRGAMPSLPAIMESWAALEIEDLEEVFPRIRVPSIGWGEPLCFRCGWLAPVPDAACFKDLDADLAIRKAWKGASGWLERAHLQDHAYGGSSDALNLVPLCVICHEQQPPCETREQGIAFVNSEPRAAQMVGLVQMHTDTFARKLPRPGRSEALRKMLRAQAAVGVAMSQAFYELQEKMRSSEEDADP